MLKNLPTKTFINKCTRLCLGIALFIFLVPNWVNACTESGFGGCGTAPIDNGDGTYTINLTAFVATNQSPTGSLSATGGVWWSLPGCNILSASPLSFTSLNGTTINAVISGGTVTWGTPNGPFNWILNNEPPQSFPFTVVVDCNPQGMQWQGGGQEGGACGPGSQGSSPWDYICELPCPAPTIALAGPSDITICEGETVTLTVLPTGNTGLTWVPDGQTTETITVTPTTTTTYTAIASNDCDAAQTSVTVFVDPAPAISPPFDQIICIGESISVNANPLNTTTVTWLPTGTTGPVLNDTPLTTTTYTVIGSNNCGTVSYDFTVEVIQLPELFPIQGAPPAICPGDNIELIVDGFNYDFLTWIPTGDIGTTIFVAPPISTSYTAIATNFCGSVTVDFPVNVLELPMIIPAEDESTCPGESVTLEIDAINGILYQWEPGIGFDSVVTVAPDTTTTYIGTVTNSCGSVSDTVVVEVGEDPEIDVVDGNQNFCTGESLTFSVDTTNADSVVWQPGSINATSITVSPGITTTYTVTVFNECGDVSENITATLVPEIQNSLTLQACDGTTATYDGTTLAIGSVTDFTFTGPNGCDSTVTVTVEGLSVLTNSIALDACQGQTADYNGNDLAIGSSTDFTFTSSLGCDSIVTVTVNGLPVFTTSLTLEACEGETADYNGNDLAIGSSTDFMFTAANGCDSTVTVGVNSLDTYQTPITLEACSNETADYNGNALNPGSTTDFSFTATNGCDSTVTVSVSALNTFTSSLTLEACQGETADYDGNSLAIGSSTDFTLSAANGCDSVVTVNVDQLDVFNTPLTLQACDGTTADYNGNALAIGSTTDFLFTAANGCDSTVTVSVDQLDTYNTPLTLEACDGTTADYNGNALAIGSTTDFLFTAANGCDSTVTVSVDQLDIFNTPLTLEACDGNTADYNGNALAIGTTTDFVFPAANGCDSTVSVTIDGLDVFASDLTLQTCQGTDASYQGSTLAIGSTTDFTLTALNGCDSVVTVMVEGIDNFASDLNLQTCDGTTASYQGSDLAIGSSTDFTFVSVAGCDSIVTVTVSGISAFLTTIDLETCDGTTADYNGNALAVGSSTDFLFTAASGCDSIVTVNVDGLPIFTEAVQLETCDGTTADYNGNALAVGSSTDFLFTAANGCDSTVTVDVMGLSNFTNTVDLETCDGTTADYNGNALAIGSSTDFPFIANNGCDSVVTVNVAGIPILSDAVTLQTCTGVDAMYQGTSLPIGSVTDFTFTSSLGCDSIVTVDVVGTPVLTESVQLETCDGTMADYNGTMLAIGTSTDFMLTTPSGCDSVVTVSVVGISISTASVQLEACPGTEATYQGTSLPIGSSTDFTLVANSGCDSIVTVDVVGTPVLTESVQLEICDGTMADYNGTMLAIGSTTDFMLSTPAGCDSIVTVSVTGIPILDESLQFDICDGTTYDYNGTTLAVGSSTDFTFTSSLGCDSIVTVAIDGIPILTESLQFEICEGNTFDYNGNDLAIGSSSDFTFTSSLGCDSIVTVAIDGLLNSAETLELQTCDGTEATYQGTSLPIGSSTDFTLVASNGCDSTVTVDVVGLSILTSSVQLEACDGNDALYNGNTLAIGTSTDFTFMASSGCDSIVTVTVDGLQNFMTPLTLQACDGTTADYNGNALAIGTTTDFPFTAANGCDSTVAVTVDGLQVFASNLNLETCDGTTATYQGSQLAIGSSTDFTFPAANGCDSIVTVTVDGLQNFTTPLTLEACDGTTATYQGQQLAIGSMTPFAFTAANGCDSTVMVSVDALQVFASDLTLEACDGTTAFYLNQSLDIGTSTPFTLTAINGCDSVVTVSVEGLPIYQEDLLLESCQGESITYDGVEVPPGGNVNIPYTTVDGCDSIVTVFAMDVLPLSASEEDIIICDGETIEIFGQSISNAGDYSNTFAAVNGCDSVHTVILEVLDPILIEPTTENSCQDDQTGSASILASGGLPPFNYSWSNGAVSTSIADISSGNYLITVTDGNGCTEVQDILVGQHDIDQTVVVQDVTCFEDTDGTIIVEAPDPTWTLTLEGTSGNNTSGIFANLSAGNYSIVTTDEFGCVYTSPYTINQPNPIIVDLPNDTMIELGNEVPVYSNYFNGVGSLIFDWNTNDFFEDECDNCTGGLTRPLENIEYILTITDEDGCVAVDNMNIIVENPFNIFIPNVFSPNGDGVNDTFMIFGQEGIAKVNVFKVFSRWGEMVFQDFDFFPNDPTHSWTGEFLGENMNPAVFVYYAEIEFIDGVVKLYKGDVTLVR